MILSAGDQQLTPGAAFVINMSAIRQAATMAMRLPGGDFRARAGGEPAPVCVEVVEGSTNMRSRTRWISALGLVALAGGGAGAQCPVTELTSGLQIPLGITQTNKGDLIVSETGTVVPNTGRISIVDLDGNRRTLLDGLPSGINDVNEPSGPAGLFMRGRTLYVAIGVGDVGRAGPLPGTTVPNANPPSSPIFSSILAIHFSPKVERTTAGFTLTAADHQALASGEKKLKFSNGGDDKITVKLIANFPDFTPNPLPFFPANVRLSNPFQLVTVGDQVHVTDGGQNSVRQVDIRTGMVSTLATFPNIPNPFFNPTPPPSSLGGPFVEAVPTGIRFDGQNGDGDDDDGQLLVTLFRGFPFPPGASVVERVDLFNGTRTPFITGLKTAIDVLPIRDDDADDDEERNTGYLVLQHASGSGPLFTPPGLVLHFETPGGPPTTIANCLTRPTSMTLDEKTGTLYVTELAGRIVAIPVTP